MNSMEDLQSKRDENLPTTSSDLFLQHPPSSELITTNSPFKTSPYLTPLSTTPRFNPSSYSPDSHHLVPPSSDTIINSKFYIEEIERLRSRISQLDIQAQDSQKVFESQSQEIESRRQEQIQKLHKELNESRVWVKEMAEKTEENSKKQNLVMKSVIRKEFKLMKDLEKGNQMTPELLISLQTFLSESTMYLKPNSILIAKEESILKKENQLKETKKHLEAKELNFGIQMTLMNQLLGHLEVTSTDCQKVSSTSLLQMNQESERVKSLVDSNHRILNHLESQRQDLVKEKEEWKKDKFDRLEGLDEQNRSLKCKLESFKVRETVLKQREKDQEASKEKWETLRLSGKEFVYCLLFLSPQRKKKNNERLTSRKRKISPPCLIHYLFFRIKFG